MRLPRRKRVESDQRGDNAVVAAMRRAAQVGATGAIVVERDRDRDRDTVRIYVFEGGVYAADSLVFHADTARRLISSGLVPEHAAAHAPSALVDSFGLAVEQLASVHQEVMLAIVGTVVDLPDTALTAVTFADGVTTDSGCTLPVEVDSLLAILQTRRDRLQQDLATVDPVAPSQEGIQVQVAVAAAGAGGVGTIESPVEARVLFERIAASATDGHPTIPLDLVAGECGFTRAEAVHLAVFLAERGLIDVSVSTAELARDERGTAPVPEAIAG